MGDQGQKGVQFLEEAQKKLKNSQGFLSSFFGGGSRIDEAIDLYVRAANSFKMAKKWGEAGNAFIEAAQLHLKQNNKHDAGTLFVDAANCFKKVDPNQSIRCLEKTIELYQDMGRFTTAAKHHISIAEIYESELVDFDKTVLHYQTAADYYQGEESKVSANRCLLKVAQYSALKGDFQKSAEIYEQVAGTCIESPLLKYSAKEHYFRATLCHMCVDVLNAENALKKYQDCFPHFIESRECKFLQTLINKLEENDSEGFTQAIQDYDSISPLDSWYTNLLLRIKQNIENEPDLK
ncbi:hypothetical protein DERP_011215 [Dermatophagoides pteronyssinus]|uniref:Uncharacterized protein n=2 Tax=Dermatophagoides pteronyssinus TaxID=6956 RepID=A0ABQ8JCH6_DERPT|nr:alpha-soluble NSF attachment protein-like [Dermatophagoides pteronyssinus]KAH9420299.1 hypothetical protein DERP_011215 [Dermatophagoides pteronyssinus]